MKDLYVPERDYSEPGERIDKLLQLLKGKRSLRTLRGIVSEVLKANPGDMKDFSHRIGSHKWRGIVYLKRNSLMGTIVSFFDNKLLIVRGYPKIKYSDDSRVYNKQCVSQEKVDGTNFGIWKFSEGTLMGKTRMTETWLGMAWKRENLTWKGLIERADNGEFIKKVNELLSEHDYVVYGELYGKLNPGDFIKYSVDIAFKVFDILDRKTQRFLPPEKVVELSASYNLPIVKQTWEGTLTDKEINRIEFELEQEMKEDGMEGWVAKTYLQENNDVYMCKLKCDKIKEECWSRDKKPTIPMTILRKAVRKVLENFPNAKTIETMEPYVLDELREDVEETLIELSMHRIREQIRFALTPSDEDLYKLIKEKMEEMQSRGIDLENKGHVLSNLATALGSIKGETLYRLYQQVMRELS